MITSQQFRRWAFIGLISFVVGIVVYFVVFAVNHFHHHHQPKNTIIQELYYTQTLNHFSTDPTTFQQRFFVDRTYWSGRDGNGDPIFVFLGGDSPISYFVGQVGVLNNLAPKLGALVIYIEHRFYGHSVPYGWPIRAAIADPVVRDYLTTRQALADYEEIIVKLKANLSAVHSPVVLLGSFYGGILATWLMMEYPGVAIGALASSAPMYYFYNNTQDGVDDFCAIISKDFKETNPQCHRMIRQSWSAIDKIASRPNGLNILSSTFKTCRPLQLTYELKSFLAHFYTFLAQYGGPHEHWINEVCDLIAGSNDDGIMSRISEGFFLIIPVSCKNITDGGGVPFFKNEDAMIAWSWQQCNEFVIPTGCHHNSMLPVKLFDVSQHITNCEQQYGKSPPPNWIGNQIGGNDLKAALSNISGKIIFSNGMRDPYSSKGVLHNISHTIIAIKTEQGSHVLDLKLEQTDDPKWLVDQRKKEIELITQWIEHYSPH